MYKIVLIRHGESTWNKENRFTGWTDVDLTDKGKEQAKNAGNLLKAEGLMTRNPKMVERKKPGQKKARKRFQFSKR